MKPDNPKSGREASFEKQYLTKDECTRAADAFAAGEPSNVKRYELKNGFSFGKGNVEHRFIFPGSASITYYEAKKNRQNIKTLADFQQAYSEYMADGYPGRQAPHEDGGTDGCGGNTARCLLQDDKAARGEEFGLIINPPFPHGSPIFFKHHGGKRRKTKGYLLVLAGLVAGLAFGPIRKALRKR